MLFLEVHKGFQIAIYMVKHHKTLQIRISALWIGLHFVDPCEFSDFLNGLEDSLEDLVHIPLMLGAHESLVFLD